MTLEIWGMYLVLPSSMKNAGVLNYSSDGGELSKNINRRIKTNNLSRHIHSATNLVGKNIHSICMWNILK